MIRKFLLWLLFSVGALAGLMYAAQRSGPKVLYMDSRLDWGTVQFAERGRPAFKPPPEPAPPVFPLGTYLEEPPPTVLSVEPYVCVSAESGALAVRMVEKKTTTPYSIWRMMGARQGFDQSLAWRFDLKLLPVAWGCGAAFVLLFALPYLRRSRRKREGCCRKCGYQLTGLVEPRCPECGTGFEKPELAQELP